jgi:GT2 family glycosyltransferase
MSEGQSIWVGSLDLDEPGMAAGVTGPPRADQSQARVLIRMHRAPMGFVHIATQPRDTLTERARSAAEAALAEQLRRHAVWDNPPDPDSSKAWANQAACPRRFAAHGGAGVSVVICTRNRTELLKDCLRTLRAAAYDPLEILVVDNAPSSHATRDLVLAVRAHDPRVRYTCEPVRGLSSARNRGLAEARFDIVAFTDDDILIDPGWPAAIAAGFATDPEAICVTGLVMSGTLDTSSQRYFDALVGWGEDFEPRRFDLAEHRLPAALYPFRAGVFGTGANLAVRRSELGPVGVFDPVLGAGGPCRGGEDLDMLLRIILAGGRICYLPAAMVWHLYNDETLPLGQEIYSYGHGLGAYLAKHMPNPAMRAALLRHGVRQVGVVLSRMHQASQQGRPREGSRRLVLNQAEGVLMGALRYWRARRALGSS